ncbi:MAG: hypothetical protein ACYTEQ_26385 [Planctomycetota bacterium]
MCDSCEVVNINGCNCHETGCPDAWRDYKRECKCCGREFKPRTRYQDCCADCIKDFYE